MFGYIIQNGQTETYTTLDWITINKTCSIKTYLDNEKPTASYSNEKSFDEIMEEVLEDYKEAWERLANL